MEVRDKLYELTNDIDNIDYMIQRKGEKRKKN